MMKQIVLCTLVALVCLSIATAQITKLDNGLAGQQFVYQPPADQFIQKCDIKGKPLDMMIIVDSSGSVQDKWPDVQAVLKSVIRYITIAPDGSATRVSMLIYAKNVRKVFDFNTFYRREDMLKAVDNVRPINGVTNTGNALNTSLQYWNEERGMRGPEVPKFLFLFSDGRASDFPKDTDSALILRDTYNIPIFVYGYGEHLDWNPLTEIVGGDSLHIVNSRNASEMFNWIAPWKGIEICEDVPACIPGAHRPVDLLFIIDTSSSFEEKFPDTINFVQSMLNNINVHPDAVRVSMIMYSTRPQLVFDFKKYKSTNELNAMLIKLAGPKVSGTTGTAEALKLATEVFEPIYGARSSDDVKRVAMILTDGHSTSNPNV
jgi:collagen type VI alpha